MKKCEICGEEDDKEYFKVKWEDCDKLVYENKVVCSICADDIWNHMNKYTIEIIRVE